MAFFGQWNFVSSENFDNYMIAVGFSPEMAALGSKARPTLYISIDGDTWTLKSVTTMKTTIAIFQLGVEFDETTADGRQMKTTFTLNGNEMVQHQNGEIPSIITRIVDGDKLTVHWEAKGVVSTRIYNRA